MSMIPLLMNSQDVSEETRAALRAVVAMPPDQRGEARKLAARTLYRDVQSSGVDCDDVKALVGLPDGGCNC